MCDRSRDAASQAPGQHDAPETPGHHGAPEAPGQHSAAPSSARHALAALHGALAHLASADPAALTVVEQAECLRELQRAESMRIAAQSSVLAAFEANCGYADDGHGTARSWLRWQTRVTGPAASAAVAWTRRLAAHPAVREALTAGQVSESWARQICDWTDLLPVSARTDADTILLAAAGAGASLQDLAGLAEEMRARTAKPDSDGDGPADRSLRLDLHYRGAARLRGDLTPRCAAALQAVLDALGKKQGREDIRSQSQRDHDALEEACRRLIAAGLVPDRAGQSTQIQLHMNLIDLLGRPTDDQPGPGCGQSGAGQSGSGGPGLRGPGLRGPGLRGPAPAGPAPAGLGPAGLGPAGPRPSELARRRLYPGREDLTGPETGGYTGPGSMARPGDLCDASIVPIVTGDVDHEFLARLAAALIASGAAVPADGRGATGRSGDSRPGHDERLTDQYMQELILRGAVALLSGPQGLASRLRTGTLSGPAGSISLPLDVGTATDTVPPHLRRAVTLRDKHCAFPGCESRTCQVHHIVPVSEGGPTRLDHLALACPFHHLIAIHEWGWKLVVNADGTKTAISPDGRRVLHSHGPPQAA